jgi:hypothetical protein
VKKMKEKTVEGCLISVRIFFKNYISPRGTTCRAIHRKNQKLLNLGVLDTTLCDKVCQ